MERLTFISFPSYPTRYFHARIKVGLGECVYLCEIRDAREQREWRYDSMPNLRLFVADIHIINSLSSFICTFASRYVIYTR